MNKVDAMGLAVCRFQGRVFEISASALPTCGSAVFVRRFMRSNVAVRLDGGGYSAERMDPSEIVAEVDAEYAGKPYGSQAYATEALYWMGYVYRYWCIASGLSSKAAYAIAGAREMAQLYYPYHTLDPQQAIERILEAKGTSIHGDDIARGVEALRRIRGGLVR